MHKHYNMSIDYYFLCFVTLVGCVLFVIVLAQVENYACFSLLLMFLLFVDLTLLVLFLSVLKKIQKPIKIEKSLKSLITCIVYISCEFSLVPSYLWHSAFTSLACYVCTYIFVGKNLKTMGDCCKQIFKLVMNDWSIVLILAQTYAYISSHLYFSVFAIELTKCKSQNEKEIRSCKSLSHILVFDQEKGKATLVLNCMVLKKPKDNSQC